VRPALTVLAVAVEFAGPPDCLANVANCSWRDASVRQRERPAVRLALAPDVRDAASITDGELLLSLLGVSGDAAHNVHAD